MTNLFRIDDFSNVKNGPFLPSCESMKLADLQGRIDILIQEKKYMQAFQEIHSYTDAATMALFHFQWEKGDYTSALVTLGPACQLLDPLLLSKRAFMYCLSSDFLLAAEDLKNAKQHRADFVIMIARYCENLYKRGALDIAINLLRRVITFCVDNTLCELLKVIQNRPREISQYIHP